MPHAKGAIELLDGSRPGDWRLQTKEEWEGIPDPSCTTQPEIVGNQSPTPGCYTDAGDAASGCASGVVSSIYWSSTTWSIFTPSAWGVNFVDGGALGRDKINSSDYVWPVRGGR